MDLADWIGWGHESAPKPPPRRKAFTFFRRGLLVGLPAGAFLCAVLQYIGVNWR